MAYQITLDWNAIQERNIDPFSPVDSDNHNKLLKILGSTKAYIRGFDISYERDDVNNKMIAHFTSGVGVVSYIVIEMLQNSTIELFSCPITERTIHVVLDYKYQKIQPVPVASLKSIRTEEYDPTRHLILYTFRISNWSLVPTLSAWNTWISNEANFDDGRTADDVIPEWATATFVKKAGDTLEGPLLVANPTPTLATEVICKQYVDTNISNHDSQHDDRFVRLAGSTMTGQLTLVGDPTAVGHAARKAYVDAQRDYVLSVGTNTYLPKAGGTMTGALVLHADPSDALGAATKQYVDTKTANHDAEHDDRFVRLAGSTMTGFLTLHANPTSALHSATKGYVDNLIANHDSNHDDRFLKLTGGSLTGHLRMSNTSVYLQNYTTAYYDAVRIYPSVTSGYDYANITSNHRIALRCDPLDGTDGDVNNMRISFFFNASEVAYVNRYGLVGAVYNSDIIEFFEHDLKVMPRQGQCIVLNDEGKAVVSYKEADPNVIGFVSYSPGLTLGGTTEFEEEFEKGRLPVALLGQIPEVLIESEIDRPAGSLLVSGKEGRLKLYKDMETVEPGCIIAKALKPILAGVTQHKILIFNA